MVQRDVGLHLRLTNTLQKVIEKAIRMELNFFQCFFIIQKKNLIINPPYNQIKEFVRLRRKYFNNIFLHGSYWINLSSIVRERHRALERELELAKKLEFSHIILHPGSAKGAQKRLEGVDALARQLNRLLKEEENIKFVLENTAHGNMTIGGDLYDFKLLLEKLDKPEKLHFCIDTAHAYSFGYDITKKTVRQDFIQLIESTIGIEKIALIHLNDTKEVCGSKMDRHYIVGEGNIGGPALKEFILNDRLKHIPVLMELPQINEQDELQYVKKVCQWHS